MLLNQNLLSERYQLLEIIGQGGMATVYKARDLTLNRLVAIKVMNPELTREKEFIQRFIWEAKATGSLSHKNIVSIYDAGSENQTYYMVMEYVDGITLKELIQQKGIIPVDEAIAIASQICDALDHAHQNDIIHRDIKPQNIMCSADGYYRITDFGISRLTRSSSKLTKTGLVMGSVHYFSPEQAQGKPVDHTTDLYSLGVVLYEMLTGQLPYDASEQIAVALMHIQQKIPNPQDQNPDIPDALCKLIEKAMAKNPKNRFQSALEMKEALQSLHTKSLVNQPETKQETSITSQQTSTKKPVPKKRNPKIVWGTVSAVVAVFITLFLYSIAEANFFKEQTVEPSASKHLDIETSQAPPIAEEEKPIVEDEKNDKPKQEKPKTDKQPEHKKEKPKPKKGDFIIVIGSFTERENAERLSKQLDEKGFQTTIQKSIVFGQTMHRVIGGEFETKAEAEQQLEQMKQSGIKGTQNAIIIKLEKTKK